MKELESHVRQRLWNTKALSVNKCWQGRRFKSQEYGIYEKEILYKLPKKYRIPEGELRLALIFGVSSKGGDIDNLVKPFSDILQKKYGFNDNRIYELKVWKQITKKGEEYIEWFIETM